MNIREDIKGLKTGANELRKFGLLVGGVLGTLGLLFLLRHKRHWPWFLYPGVLLMVFGMAWPRLLKWVYVAWMSAAFVLGFIVAHVILTLLFYLILTPIGLIARLTGKDFLRLKLDPSAQTYWIVRQHKPANPAEYERQF